MKATDHMEKALRAANSARLLLQSDDLEGACDRAYYAMFNAARAALLASNAPVSSEIARTHNGLIAAFSLHLVKSGIVPLEFGRALNRVEELRLIADYRGDPIEPMQAAWAVDQARNFVSSMELQFMQPARLPVIAIDGPSASGKGTVAQLVAKELGFHYLDSGALYRIVALAGKRAGIDWQDEAALARMAGTLVIRFEDGEIVLNGGIVSDAVRSEEMSRGASEVAVHPLVRQALFDVQRAFCKAPGLVADGRDMGSVVFPEAQTKVFLTASAAVRADRRYKQLINKGNHANLAQILADIEARDLRDMQRSAAPLRQCDDASLLDTSDLTIAQAVEKVLVQYRQSQK